MDEREIDWRGSAYKDLCDMPDNVRQTFGFALGLAQNNLPYEDAKTLSGFKPALVESLRTMTATPTALSIQRILTTSSTSALL
jgi:phage-related protein